MSAADWHILCLFHGTQGQAADERLLFRPLNFLQKLLQFLRMHLTVVGADSVAKVIDEHAQALHLLRIRVVVGTIDKRKLLPEIILRNGLVGHQHEIFNDLGCHISIVWLNINRMSLLIKNNLGLRKIKVNRTTFSSFFPQNSCKFLHQFKHRNQFFIFSDFRFVFIFQNFFNTCI